jgi:predicted transcriptional regulator
MDSTVLMSVRLSARLAKRLERVAEQTERSRSWVAIKAIEEYLDLEEEALESIQRGIKDIEAGRIVSQRKVVAWLRDLAVGKVRKPPRASKP